MPHQQDKYTCHVLHIKLFTFYVQSIKENVIYKRKTNFSPLKLKKTMLGLYIVSSITLEVVFNNHNPLRFLCLIEFEKLAFHKLGEIESTTIRLMTFFTKHICQCSLKRATKPSKDLFVKP